MPRSPLIVVTLVLLASLVARAADAPQPGTPPADGVVVTLDSAKPLPSSPGYHVVRATATWHNQQIPLALGLFLPASYFEAKEPFPVVVALHNRGLKGENGAGLTGEGFGNLLVQDAWDTRATGPRSGGVNVRQSARFIALLPQCPPSMVFESAPMPQIIEQLLDVLAAHYRVDQDRVYLTGFSYGGTSTWSVAMAIPKRFAAIVPIAGRAPPGTEQNLARLMGLPIYMAVGTRDGSMLPEFQRMLALLGNAGHPSVKSVTIEGGNHFCYGVIYTDPAFWQWLYAQRRGQPMAATRPTSRPTTQSIASHP